MALFNGESVYPLLAQFMPFKPGAASPTGASEGGMWYDFSTKQYKGIINGVITVINGTVTSLFGAGAPPGGAGQCTAGQTYTNTTNGNLYSCSGTTWVIVSGSAVTVAQLNAIQPQVLDTTALAGADLGARLNTCNSQLGVNGGICNALNEPFNVTISTAAVISNPITVWGCGRWVGNVAGGISGITFSSAGGGGLQGCPDKAFTLIKNISGTLIRVSGTNIVLSDVVMSGNGNIGRTGTLIDPTGSTDAVFSRISLSNLDVSGIQTTAAANRLILDRVVISTQGIASSAGIVLVGGSITISNSTVALASTGDTISGTGTPSSIVIRDSLIQSTGTSGTGLNCTTCQEINITGSQINGTTRALNVQGPVLYAAGNTFSGGVTECILMGSNSLLFTGNKVNWSTTGSGRSGIHLKGDTIGNIISDNVIKGTGTPTGDNYNIWLDTSGGGSHYLGHRITENYISGSNSSFDVGIFIDNTANLAGSGVTLTDNRCIDVGVGKCIVRVDSGSVAASLLTNNSGNNGATYSIAGSNQDIFTVAGIPFASLPNAGPPSHIYCSDCTPNVPTAGSGVGSYLIRDSANRWIGVRTPTVSFVSGSDYTNATTTFSNVTGLSFAVPILNATYSMHCSLVWSASAATAGPQFQITGPTNVTLSANMVSAITSSTTASAATTTFSSAMNPVGATVTSGVNEFAQVDMGFLMGATGGTINLQAAAQGAGTLTIRQGSFCEFK